MSQTIVRLCFIFAAASMAVAGTISTSGDAAGTPLNVIGITGFATFGSEMGGLTVTATFGTAGTQDCIWAPTSATAGGCSEAGWFSITQDGDTFSSPWTFTNLSNSGVTSLVLNGSPGRLSTSGVVFDRTFGGVTGTPGSAMGNDLSGSTSDALSDGEGTYSDIVAVIPEAPVGDLFAQLSIAFSAPLGGGHTATFVADTDTVGLSQIPEPGSLGLLALGGMILAARKYARR